MDHSEQISSIPAQYLVNSPEDKTDGDKWPAVGQSNGVNGGVRKTGDGDGPSVQFSN
jgi:hypothetical protein